MTRLRPSTLFGAAILLLLAGTAAAGLHARTARIAAAAAENEGRTLVARLGLTDLCLTTEASYCRNPALTDARTPFQDHPGALEHFPSGALIAPPPHLTPTHAPRR
ncbi:hypothetical protein [Geomesophilobacter sediminis]|uniref:Uncharacterized protein n=1 Tax=Geomesophilobacter sediminis TaxID=2798584 RepID=A0A8J7LU44_9BACT|nr:hypothetical protein [Geomesophilobacter sediminis]MBJ6723355.1 hypothetical protein [Geomesophilobacter sediminis]